MLQPHHTRPQVKSRNSTFCAFLNNKYRLYHLDTPDTPPQNVLNISALRDKKPLPTKTALVYPQYVAAVVTAIFTNVAALAGRTQLKSITAHIAVMATAMNFVTFNQDYSCLAVGTRHGYRIYTCDPFGKVYENKEGDVSIIGMLFGTSLVALVFSPRRLVITNTKVRSGITYFGPVALHGTSI
jgi:hypothetical protein